MKRPPQQATEQAPDATVRNEPSSSRSVLCRCGAGPHAEHADICARGHALPGNRKTVKHGMRSARPLAGVPPMPEVGQVAAHHLEVIHGHLAKLSAHVASHAPRLSDVRHVETLLSLTAKAAELEAQLPRAGRQGDTCAFGHRDCLYLNDPLFEAQLFARAALEKFKDRIIVLEPDCVAEALLSDPHLCDDVLRRLRAQVVPPTVLVEDDAQDVDVTFGPDGEVLALTVDGVAQEPEA